MVIFITIIIIIIITIIIIIIIIIMIIIIIIIIIIIRELFGKMLTLIDFAELLIVKNILFFFQRKFSKKMPQWCWIY